MRKIALCGTFALIAVLVAACEEQQRKVPAPTGTEPAKSTAPVETEVGLVFSITLESNPTTGYRWQLATPLDEKIIKLVGSKYVAPKAGRLGVGGKEVWTFKAVGRGKAEISLKYVRPWEKDVPPAQRQVISVEVR